MQRTVQATVHASEERLIAHWQADTNFRPCSIVLHQMCTVRIVEHLLPYSGRLLFLT